MNRISIAIVSFLIIFGIAASPAHAAKQCKGIEKNACADSLDCSWVKGYTRKNKTEVKGHCRTNKSAAKAKAKLKQKEAKSE